MYLLFLCFLQFAGGSMGGQPSAFGDGIQGSSYRMGGSDQRHTLQGQSNVFAPEQQRHLSAQPTQGRVVFISSNLIFFYNVVVIVGCFCVGYICCQGVLYWDYVVQTVILLSFNQSINQSKFI